jgi:O-antigen ligase
MNANASETEIVRRRSVLSRSAVIGETSIGLTVLALGGGIALLYEFAMALGRWVPFVLSYKPLIDLTWRWELIEVFNQRVNPQAVLAVFVTLLNGIVVLFARRRVPHYRLVLLLLGLATVSVILTPTPWGINELLRLYAGASFFFTAGLVLSNKRRFDRFVQCFLWALTVPVVLSLFQVAGLVPYEYWDWTDAGMVGRASGSYQHPLDLVFYLVYAIPLTLYRLEDSKQKGANRAFPIVFLSLSMLVLVSTILRMGWFAICMQIGLWLVFKQKYKLITFAGVALLALVIAFSAWIEMLYEPVTQAIGGEVDVSSQEFFRGRGVNWYVFLNSYVTGGPIRWLVGRGGSVPLGDTGLEERRDIVAVNEPHNDFIRLLHAYGILGLLLYLAILWNFFRDSWALRKSVDGFSQNVGNVLFVALTAVLLLSITAEPMRYPTGIWYLFVLGSVAAVLRQQHDSRSRQETDSLRG